MTYEKADAIGYAYYIPDGERLMDVLVGLRMCESHKAAKAIVRSGGVRVGGREERDPVFALEGQGRRYRVAIGSGVGLVASGATAKTHEVVVR